MLLSRLRVSLWSMMAACALTAGSAHSITRESARLGLDGFASASGTDIVTAGENTVKRPDVFPDSDSLALRELVGMSTEFIEPKSRLGGDLGDRVHAKILAINDFHGNLSTTRELEGRPLGGAAVLAAYLKARSRGFEGRTVIAHAGDFVGASPAESSLFQDEPSIEFFNRLSNGRCDRSGKNPRCNLVGILGNHEFDRGTTELLRLVHGGSHEQGPLLAQAFHGATYPTICANVSEKESGRPLLPPYIIKDLGGMKVGFVGAVLRGASWFLTKSGIADVVFKDEASSINESVVELKKRGVRAIVAMIHQGGHQRFSRELPRDSSMVTGEIAGIVRKLDGEIDVVVSGHSHSVLTALLPNRDGRPTLLTQAFHSGTAFADIDLEIDRGTRDVVSKRASIVSTFADSGPGLKPDAAVARIVDAAVRHSAEIRQTIIGRAPEAITSSPNVHGESALGDLVADAQRAAMHTDFAFTTPAWVRGSIRSGDVTWDDLFTVQPFGNRLMRVELTGAEVVALLNEQWSVESYLRILNVSGLSYRWDARRRRGDRVVEVRVDGRPIELDKIYSAAVNQFLAEGGEGFASIAEAPRTPSAWFDIDALVAYVRHTKIFELQRQARIRRIDIPL